MHGHARQADRRGCATFALRICWSCVSLRLGLIAIACCLGAFTHATSVAGAAVTKLVHYHGYRLAVPSGWPVYRLGLHSRQCVRFDRHAVYLGRPGAAQNCPAHAAGRTEAILVQPLSRQSRAGDERRRGIIAAARERVRPRGRDGDLARSADGDQAGTGCPIVAGPAPRCAERCRERISAGRRRLHRARVRRVRGAQPGTDVGVGIIALSRDRGLHRRHQYGLLAGEPDAHLGEPGVGRGLAHDPDLRRAPGADQLLRLCRDLIRQRHRPGSGSGDRRDRAGASARSRPRKPDLFRYGGVPARRRATRPRCWHSSRAGPRSCTPAAISPASTAALTPAFSTSPRSRAPATWSRMTSGSHAGTAPWTRPIRTSRVRPGPCISDCINTRVPTTRATAASRSTSTATTWTARRPRRAAVPLRSRLRPAFRSRPRRTAGSACFRTGAASAQSMPGR